MLENKPRKRKTSRFFAQELLYDFYSDTLDNERKKLVEESLKSDLILTEELSYIKKADAYCQSLSKTSLSEELQEELLHSRLPRERRFDNLKLRNWPEPAKWVVEALAVSVVVLLVGTILPWDSFLEKTQEFTTSRPPKSPKQVEGKAIIEKRAEVKRQQEEKIQSRTVVKKEVVASQPTEAKEEPVVTMVAAPSPKGQLYRMMMKVYNIEAQTPELRRKLQALGAKKAGKVELGWRKPDGNYFHFSVPEKNYKALLKTLDGYGRVRIYKSSHPRVMPKGTIRAILFIEDGEPPDESEQPEQEPEEASPSA